MTPHSLINYYKICDVYNMRQLLGIHKTLIIHVSVYFCDVPIFAYLVITFSSQKIIYVEIMSGSIY